MPNWWLLWAEQIALVLAEWWMRSKSGAGEAPGSGPSDDRAEPGPMKTAPDADTRPH